MTQSDLLQVLDRLLAGGEHEIVELKQAGNDYDTHKIGQYFSALANEANLRGLECAWLVFGIGDKSHRVVGTDYRQDPDRLHGLKMQLAQSTEPSITLRNIHEAQHPSGRVILFEIPAAPRGMPIAWKGHYYARAGESLTSLGLDKQDAIRQQTLFQDWSAQVVAQADLGDLEPEAIAKARENFSRKYANRFSSNDVIGWSDLVFLNRARLTQSGEITRSALLLLGRPESAWMLSPNPAQLTWKLEGPEQAYEHFPPPFLLNSSRLYQRIRNVQLRLLPASQLLPVEVSKYDQKIVLEALHNCIAHQDYARNG